MPDINPFIDVKINKLPQPDTLRGFDDLRRTSSLEVGTGNRAVKADESGIWLGANKFTDAPFSVDMEGNLVASAATFGQFLAKALTGQILSGEIIVGGSVDGKIYIKDSSDNIKVTLDQDGIAIDSGKLTIKDSGETTIIDATGLVSTANFANGVGAYTGSGTVQITNASGWSSWADIGNNLTQTFSLSRTTNVYFYHVGNYEMNGDATVINHAMQVRMVLNGTKIGTIILLQTGSGANLTKRMSTYSLAQIASVSSGSNTIKMQWRVYEGTATLAGTTFLEIGAGEKAAELGFIALGT